MTTVLPLPLQLTQAIEMASSLEDALKESYQVASTRYNPETQVRETSEGVPMLYNGGGTSSKGQCNTIGIGNLVSLDGDVVIDDNDIL